MNEKEWVKNLVSHLTELKQQFADYRVAESAWFDNPNEETAKSMIEAFRRIRMSSVGDLIAENAQLQRQLEECRQVKDHDRD